ncbi:hypothetical protein [Hymenobacter cellulosilyticus]|uniref:Uncharacterized protein n=1 Tax=Hymenobacter cellulosilyticus TaxID=2932248 RepID=A0A8T9Q2V7_9BACT|nr:hypothetical protein [Hymenobacter cellulosilyticus]UOQ71787.1 hypothetical protein MUN79_24825 [Hymenobacter cellulosilyticus]
MADYLIKSTDTRTFTLLAEAAVLGELKYTEWFSFKAMLVLTNGPSLRIEPRGFWGTTIEAKDGDVVVLSFKMNWDGNIVLKSRLGGTNRAFVLKNQGLTKSGYVLLDKHGQELLTIRPDFKWNKINNDYSVSSSELFETFASKETLVLMAIHCANYYMTMATTMIATTI